MRRALRWRPEGVDGPLAAEEVRSFVSLMDYFTQFGESWSMLNLQMAQCLDPGLKIYKDSATRWHVELARLFAVAQLIDDEPWWSRARSPILRYADDAGYVMGCVVMRPAQCAAIDPKLHMSLSLNDFNLETDWNSRDSTELSTRVCRVERPLVGLTATGAVSLVGLMHRVGAGVPTLLVAEPGGTISLEDTVDCLARMLRMQVVALRLSNEAPGKLATMAPSVPATLVNFQCDLVDVGNLLPVLREVCGKCRPRHPLRTSFIITAACAPDVRWVNDALPGLIVCWRN